MIELNIPGRGGIQIEHLVCEGICVISPEGTALETLVVADLVVPDIFAALELIEKPLRIVASLRK